MGSKFCIFFFTINKKKVPPRNKITTKTYSTVDILYTKFVTQKLVIKIVSCGRHKYYLLTKRIMHQVVVIVDPSPVQSVTLEVDVIVIE